MGWPVTINGKTYTKAMFDGFEYAKNLPDLFQDVSDVAGATVGAVGTARDLAAAMRAGPVANLQRRGRGLSGVVALDPLDATSVLPTRDLRLQPGFVPDANTFSRASSAGYADPMGVLRTAASGGLRLHAHPATGENLGALLEGSRTNVVLGSASFDRSGWSGDGAAVSASSVAAPDGTTMSKIVESAARSGHLFRFTTAMTAGQVYTVSAYLKAGERTSLALLAFDGGGGAFRSAIVNLAAGTIAQGAADLAGSQGIEALPNGVYRVWMTFTVVTGGSGSYFDFRLSNGTPTISGGSYEGDGASGLYIWGAQLEAGPTPTSYIPTTTAAVTRAADVFALPLDTAWYNSAEGTLYLETVVPPASSLNHVPFQVDNGSNDARITPVRSPSGLLSLRMVVGGTLIASPTIGAVTPGAPLRLALAYSGAGVAASLNGGAVVREAFSAGLPTMTALRLGASRSPTEFWNGSISRFAHVPRALSPDTLQRMAA